MCGIGGILSKGSRIVPPEALEKMSGALRHRGPDDSGNHLSPDGKLGLVHRRLSIIDLSPSARQPMADASGKIRVILNGEIYNYKRLRAVFSRSGYPFRTSSDTEVILPLYQNDPENFAASLRGMFALALWDENAQTLVLARDRLGIKPLYYADTPDFLIFASEIRSLAASGLVSREISMEAVSGYFSFGSIPSPWTILAQVKSVEPAVVLRVKKDRRTSRQYWHFNFGVKGSRNPDPSFLREPLKDAVASHLASDVPVGVFLSGGVDSTAVAVLTREITAQNFKSFSIAFPGSPLDEAPLARATARALGAAHVEKQITAADFKREWPAVLSAMDQPTIDGFNTFFVSKLARESSIKVALSGLGGDELFAGYRSFRLMPKLLRSYALARKIPLGVPLARAFFGFMPQNGRTESISEFFRSGGSVEAGYFAVRRLFLEREKAELLEGCPAANPENFAPLSYLRRLFDNGKTPPPVDAAHFLEMRGYMHNQLLRDADVMAMANGVEVRVPFLDHRLVESVLAFPPKSRLGRIPKELLLKGLRGAVPAEISRRPKKGFTFPMDAWLRNELRQDVEASLARVAGGLLRNVLQESAVKKVWKDFLDGRLHWSRPWSIFVLQEWLEQNRVTAAGVPRP